MWEQGALPVAVTQEKAGHRELRVSRGHRGHTDTETGQ